MTAPGANHATRIVRIRAAFRRPRKEKRVHPALECTRFVPHP